MTARHPTAGFAIDRTRRVHFTFDGAQYGGFAGDTLASALLANGVRLLARSFKYHRPRGVVTAGSEEPSALVTVIAGEVREPNIPATMLEIHDGLVVESQNRWPSLGFDLMAVNSIFAPLLAAGFYYKTFMWPKAFWERLYEPAIRRAAGLGRAANVPDLARYDTMHGHCDLLVIGSGPAGLVAARMAAEAGARVILAEQNAEAGGGAVVDPAMRDWADDMLSAISMCPDAHIVTRATAIGAYDSGVITLAERLGDHLAEKSAHSPRQRLLILRPRLTLLASGTVERLIALPGNDLPGVMLASAARAYVNRFGALPGKQAAFLVNNDEAYAAIRDLASAGITIAAIADPRAATPIMRDAEAAGLPVFAGHDLAAVQGTRRVTSVTLRRIASGYIRRIACDLVCLSGGYTPQTQLATQAGNATIWQEDIAGFAARSGPTMRIAGGAAGVFGRLEAAAHGSEVARAALTELGFTALPSPVLPPVQPRRDGPIAPLFEVKGGRGKAFVDLQHDVTTDDIRLAHREGYSAAEHAKRYTTHGMGTDQGKTGGLVGSAVLAEARGEPLSIVGVTKPRPYLTPVTWGTLAGAEVGAHLKPERRLPLHDWHAAEGAVFVKIGLWLRPLVYSAKGDTSWGPVREEARTVRRGVGITDVSSLGKIVVQGKDAGIFLDRLYANAMSSLAIGRARYGLMLREDGIIFDDGTVARLGEHHFLLTTTTAQAQAVLEHMEFHRKVTFRTLDVTLTNVGDHFAQFAIAGPRSRDVLERVVTGVDLSNAGFPFMAAGGCMIAGVPGRLFRISFSGELAYEIAVPAGFARHVWEAILAAGRDFGIRPYGLDALNVLRIEKGHVAGSELNGQTSASDLGLGKMLKKNGDFIGKLLSQRPGLKGPERLALVGVHPVDPAMRLRNGAHLVSRREPNRSQGYLTAACMTSEGSHEWIGLALLEGGHTRIGERLVASSPVFDHEVEVEIVSHHRVDPENARVKA
jgi:sarcosine oxidase subunit alpha